MRSFDDSATQIVGNCLAEPAHHDLILLAHNGPSGLGCEPDSPCGLDFRPEYGDFGDRDMEEAIRAVLEKRRISLCVFGHMHQELHPFALPLTERRMFHLDAGTGVAYVNTAVVPRIRRSKKNKLQHNFVLIRLGEARVLESVESVWLERKKGGSFETVETSRWFCLEAAPAGQS